MHILTQNKKNKKQTRKLSQTNSNQLTLTLNIIKWQTKQLKQTKNIKQKTQKQTKKQKITKKQKLQHKH